jgi:hypothetical protein
MKISRRQLAMLAVAIPAGVQAQAPAADSDEETRSAHELLKSNAEAMAKVKVPIETEPAVHFKA